MSDPAVPDPTLPTVPTQHVVDPADPRLDEYRDLRARESHDLLWAEGPTVVERLLASPLEVRSVLLTPSAQARLVDRCGPVLAAAVAGGTTIMVAEQRVVNAVVGFDLHRGTIAVAPRPAPVPLGAVIDGARRIVVLEGVNDPENLGAIARSARALGADALVLDPTCADPWYRRSVRVSMGELLHLPVTRAPLAEVLGHLHAAGIDCWALTPRADAEAIGDVTVPDRLALLAGAEGPGLSAAALASCRNVRIPIRAEVDSLNVGHAVAVALALVASSFS